MSDTVEDDDSTIALFHWGPEEEPDEIEEITALIETGLYEMDSQKIDDESPLVITRRITENTPKALLAAIQEVFAGSDNRLMLYLSAHGNRQGLCFSAHGGPEVSYAQLLQHLGAVAGDNPNLEIVFGSCQALSIEVYIQQHLPPCVAHCWGFADSPTAQDVAALMAGVIADNIRLYQALSQENHRASEQRQDESQNISPNFEAVLNEFTVEAYDWVLTQEERRVVYLSRNPDTGQWHRRVILVPPKPLATAE